MPLALPSKVHDLIQHLHLYKLHIHQSLPPSARNCQVIDLVLRLVIFMLPCESCGRRIHKSQQKVPYFHSSLHDLLINHIELSLSLSVGIIHFNIHVSHYYSDISLRCLIQYTL